MNPNQTTCPRRMNEYGPWKHEEGRDSWVSTGGLIDQETIGSSCSFCGSLHPDRFMELVRDGWIVEPTDKSYKAYLARPYSERELARRAGDPVVGGIQMGVTVAKFYYMHLSEAQMDEFIVLLNSRAVAIGYPGRFHVLPYFATAGQG